MPRFSAAIFVGLLGVAGFVLTACATFPEVDAVPASTIPTPPQLVPLDTLLAEADVGKPFAPTSVADRAARLKARAALMRGAVHDPETRARLEAAARENAP
ncbi:hypothetical protein [Tabrizicola sp. BL-A-41-H6]|uniref:hypothetical protein n=1 Tax=Tabrizicola sp. BL-A-41-H6 TaxID=3421107 RepID=UPI003D672EFA